MSLKPVLHLSCCLLRIKNIEVFFENRRKPEYAVNQIAPGFLTESKQTIKISWLLQDKVLSN